MAPAGDDDALFVEVGIPVLVGLFRKNAENMRRPNNHSSDHWPACACLFLVPFNISTIWIDWRGGKRLWLLRFEDAQRSK